MIFLNVGGLLKKRLIYVPYVRDIMCATNSISGLKERINSSNSLHFQRTEEEYTRKGKSQESRQK